MRTIRKVATPVKRLAREELAEVRRQIADLQGRERDLVLPAARETDEEAKRAKRVAWEQIRVIDGVAFMATSPVQAGETAIRRWYVFAGLAERITCLVAYEVSEYRGERFATRVAGDCPSSVHVLMFRVFELKAPR